MIINYTRRLIILMYCLFGSGFYSSLVTAHEIRPAYLQINETAPLNYDLLWKVPSNGNRVIDIQPRFKSTMTLNLAGEHALIDGFVIYRYRLKVKMNYLEHACALII